MGGTLPKSVDRNEVERRIALLNKVGFHWNATDASAFSFSSSCGHSSSSSGVESSRSNSSRKRSRRKKIKVI